MSTEIKSLEPKEVWEYFYQLTQIPRPSKSEEKIQEFMVNFGKSLGLETIKDEVGNVIIRKPATPGMENRKGVILKATSTWCRRPTATKNMILQKTPLMLTLMANGCVPKEQRSVLITEWVLRLQ
jgi:dipeptidase D